MVNLLTTHEKRLEYIGRKLSMPKRRSAFSRMLAVTSCPHKFDTAVLPDFYTLWAKFLDVRTPCVGNANCLQKVSNSHLLRTTKVLTHSYQSKRDDSTQHKSPTAIRAKRENLPANSLQPLLRLTLVPLGRSEAAFQVE